MVFSRTAILIVVLTTASCAPATKSITGAPEELESELAACGLDLSKAKYSMAELDEKYFELADHPPLSEKGYDCIAEVLVREGLGLRGAGEAFSRNYTKWWEMHSNDMWRREARAWLSENRPELVVPKFDGKARSVEPFVAILKKLCGSKADLIILGRPDTIIIPFEAREIEDDCLLMGLLAAGLPQAGIEVRSEGIS